MAGRTTITRNRGSTRRARLEGGWVNREIIIWFLHSKLDALAELALKFHLRFEISWTLLFCPLKVKVKSLSHVQLFATPWTVAYQAPPSMGFSRQEYWSGVPFPSQGIFPTQGSNQGLLHCRQTFYPLSHQGPLFLLLSSNSSCIAATGPY